MKVICSNHTHCKYKNCPHIVEHDKGDSCGLPKVEYTEGRSIVSLYRGYDCKCKTITDTRQARNFLI